MRPKMNILVFIREKELSLSHKIPPKYIGGFYYNRKKGTFSGIQILFPGSAIGWHWWKVKMKFPDKLSSFSLFFPSLVMRFLIKTLFCAFTDSMADSASLFSFVNTIHQTDPGCGLTYRMLLSGRLHLWQLTSGGPAPWPWRSTRQIGELFSKL